MTTIKCLRGTTLALLYLLVSSQGMTLEPTKKKEAKDVPGERPKVTVFSSVDLKIWGRVVMNTHYDTDDIRGNTDFATYITSSDATEVNFNPRDTRIGLAANSKISDWDAGLVVEGDFYGDNAGNNLVPRLRLGYIKVAKDDLSFTLGQDWIPIGQQNPGMIDFGILAWGGNLWWRVPQLTVRKKSGNFEWLGSLMKHRVSSDQESQEKMPWVIGRVAYSTDRSMIAFGVGGHSVEVDNIDYDPYVAVLEFKTQLSSRFSLKGEVWGGSGHGREFIRYGLDYNPSQADTIDSVGGFVSFNCKLNKGQSVNFGTGLDHPDEDSVLTPDGAVIGSVPFVENQVYFVNYQRKFMQHFSYGLELLHIDTKQRSLESINGQRFTVSFSYIF
jgi:hypothetical protein